MDLIRAASFGLLCLASALSTAPALASAESPDGYAIAVEEQRLEQVFAEDARSREPLYPLQAIYRGERADPDTFALLYTDTLDRRRKAAARRSLRLLSRIDQAALGTQARLSYDTLEYERRENLAWLEPDVRALTGVRPFNHFGGLHVEFPSLMSRDGAFPYETEEDYRTALRLDRAFARVLDNAVLRFREGLASGVVEPELTVSNMIDQIDDILAQPTQRSPLYSPVREFPHAVPESARAGLRQAFAEAIREEVNPAYRRLRDFLAREYRPAARRENGMSAMSGGRGLYRLMIERETTLELDPDAVHELGLSEVARIRRDMERVKHRIGFAGTLPEFFDHIRTDPRYHPKSRQELVDGYEAIRRKVAARAPALFSKMPETPLRIAPYPAFRERFEPGGAYYQGSADGSRAGMFLFNTYDLPSRFLTGMTTLYLHEAVPGHHFQVSLAQENESLPDFQRFGGNNAFIEGWALYAETLGYDMGLFDDPLQLWGNLDDEMLRAMRLVVDTGIHARGWSRERAMDYMLANSGMSRTDATAEVERYIANPAQALSYKVGALKILELRRKAENALGKQFDIRAFHSQVLGSGALPLPVLEAKINNWIASFR